MNHVRSLAVVSMLLLSACSSSTVKDTLGLNHKEPDEFRVVSRPPLSVPPQFNLRPPSATAASPAMTPADQAAKSMITGAKANAPATSDNTFILQPGNADTAVAPVQASTDKVRGSSSPEDQFLKKAGADKADSNIRNNMIEEKVVTQQQEEESSWWDVLSTNPSKKDPMVDAKGETQRIKKNEDEGKPVTDGDTPEVKGRDTGILGRIFGN